MPQSRTDSLPFRPRAGLVHRLTTAFVEVASRRRDRKLLAGLDAHLLRDIGLSSEEALSEASKPFWRP